MFNAGLRVRRKVYKLAGLWYSSTVTEFVNNVYSIKNLSLSY